MYKILSFLCLTLPACAQTDDTSTDDIPVIVDNDGDGFAFEDDCNDSDANIYPGAPEGCEEPLFDANCDGFIGGLDSDDDGFRACDDCNDGDALVYPNATEVCDNIDNDCDGNIDDEDSNVDLSTAITTYFDGDGDGYGDDAQPIVQCKPTENSSAESGDCNDDDENIHPGATEVCDYQDNDCNGLADRDDENVILSDMDPVCFPDDDKDGYGNENEAGLQTCFCLGTEADNNQDCADDDEAVNPDADFSATPDKTGSWDLNCDETIELEFADTLGSCVLAYDGRSCTFIEGWQDTKKKSCGDKGVYLTACMPIKTTSGMACAPTEEDRTQNCR